MRRYRNPLLPAKCHPCPSCGGGNYINTKVCRPDSTSGTPGCLSCNTLCSGGECTSFCNEGENIVGVPCSGSTTYNTQSCQKCTSTCPVGTTIASHVQRCSGQVWKVSETSSTAPFDPDSECTTCPPCERFFSARVSGCSGRFRYDPPRCVDCMPCSKGEYITGKCSAPATNYVSNATLASKNNCTACPPCPAGTYRSKACGGQSYGIPDQSCTPCAVCGMDSYVVTCGQTFQNGSAVPAGYEWVDQPPWDAGQCRACQNCSEGYYTSFRCNSTTVSDVRKCSRCDAKCPFGTYMHAKCKGDTFEAASNDCRGCTPCLPGQFMDSGKCVDGTGATSPLQRTCRECSNCSVGEYKLSVCTGLESYDLNECAACEPCPAGHYLSKPCDGSGSEGSGEAARKCLPCKTCPVGYYRVGCSVPGQSISLSTYDDVQCKPCLACPDGWHISPDTAGQCPGTGWAADQRVCVKCPSCGPGRYYASGCTGVETNGLHTCALCTSTCQVTYFCVCVCVCTYGGTCSDRSCLFGTGWTVHSSWMSR